MNVPGANTAETNVFMYSRTAAMRHGGMSKGKNHRAREGKECIRAKRALKPALPPTSRVEISPAVLGPRSITGNMTIPLSFGIGSCLNRWGATTSTAPNHEIAYASTKYDKTGCCCIALGIPAAILVDICNVSHACAALRSTKELLATTMLHGTLRR
jgi:hypothetical protein